MREAEGCCVQCSVLCQIIERSNPTGARGETVISLLLFCLFLDSVQVFMIKYVVTPPKFKMCLEERFTSNSACSLCLKTWFFRLVDFFPATQGSNFHLKWNFKNLVHIWLQL